MSDFEGYLVTAVIGLAVLLVLALLLGSVALLWQAVLT